MAADDITNTSVITAVEHCSSNQIRGPEQTVV